MTAQESWREPAAETGVLTFGPLVVNLDGLAVSVDGRDVALTYAEFLVLVTLVRQPFSVLDRAKLRSAVEEMASGKREPAMSMRSVDTHIARIRKKLADAGCDCIRTMRNVGYRFVPPDQCRA
jgi:DNA-binding response OmpR family regulator